MTERERISASLDRVREGGWTVGKVFFVGLGCVFAFVTLLPVTLLSIVALLLVRSRLPGLHWVGHAIEQHMTSPVFDAFIGAGEKLQSGSGKPPV